MNREIMTAMPIGMLSSLVVTISYIPDYDSEDLRACEVPSPETVAVPGLYLEKFLDEAYLGLNLEEYIRDYEEENMPTLAEYITTYEGFCPQIVNAMYVDEMGRVKVLDLECIDQFPSALDMGQ